MKCSIEPGRLDGEGWHKGGNKKAKSNWNQLETFSPLCHLVQAQEDLKKVQGCMKAGQVLCQVSGGGMSCCTLGDCNGGLMNSEPTFVMAANITGRLYSQ
jgi:hypothetical protein